MKRTLLFLVPFAFACTQAQSPATEDTAEPANTEVAKADTAKEENDVPVVSIDDLAKQLEAKTVSVFDANGEDTRKEFGMIPGAVGLSSYDSYSIEKELPEDKEANLVFYCSSTKCSAAPKAAERAMEAGYKNVSHLKEGIKGWVDAGKPVAKLEAKKG